MSAQPTHTPLYSKYSLISPTYRKTSYTSRVPITSRGSWSLVIIEAEGLPRASVRSFMVVTFV